ncbi:MAG: MBL fold metallo-hydrolase [Oligoflexales bacterium]|nr:MBL fold metallo-hydrolase [Oligoflexales bacterium]
MHSNITLKVRILGSGTSTGVPTIGCNCPVCTSDDPRNKRRRSSILITRKDNQENIVIDTTPDFRSQILDAKVSKLENVLYTHTHADHCHGFDDLRAFYFFNKTPINCYLSKELHPEFKARFSYAFTNTGYKGTTPQVELKETPNKPFEVIGLEVDPVRLPHGTMQSTGFRFGRFAYITDFKAFPKRSLAKWKGKIHTMIASGVRYKPHPTHSTVSETIQLFQDLQVKKGYITHLSHDIDHRRDSASLPPHISFAYDGLEFEVVT